MNTVPYDEWQRLYGRAIAERQFLPIRGKWADSVRKDRERKKKRRNSRSRPSL